MDFVSWIILIIVLLVAFGIAFWYFGIFYSTLSLLELATTSVLSLFFARIYSSIAVFFIVIFLFMLGGNLIGEKQDPPDISSAKFECKQGRTDLECKIDRYKWVREFDTFADNFAGVGKEYVEYYTQGSRYIEDCGRKYESGFYDTPSERDQCKSFIIDAYTPGLIAILDFSRGVIPDFKSCKEDHVCERKLHERIRPRFEELLRVQYESVGASIEEQIRQDREMREKSKRDR